MPYSGLKLFFILQLTLFFCFEGQGQSDCDGDVPPGLCCDGCDQPAPILCDVNDLDGYCGRTGPQNEDPNYHGFCGPFTIADNPSWFGFIAGGSTVTIQMEVSNCLGNRGVQFAIYENCAGNPPLVCESNCQGNGEIITLSIQEAVLGQTYYVMVDGCSGFFVDGDQCDYTFTILEGDNPNIVDDLSMPSGMDEVCPGQSFTYNFDAVDKAIYYGVTLPDGTYVETSDQSFDYVFPEDLPPGIYQFCLDWAGNDCDTLFGPNCIDIEVRDLPELEFGPFIRCEGDFPFVFRNEEYNAAGVYQYRETWAPDCDTMINVVIEEIINVREPQIIYVCQEDFPIESPFNDDVYEGPGAYPVPTIDQFGCDSTFIYEIQTIDFTFSVSADQDTLRCPDQITIINALNSSPSASDGTPVDNSIITWKRDGSVLIGETDEILAVDQPGNYTFILEALYQGISCVDSFEIEIAQSLPNIPDLDIVGPISGCIGGVYTFVTDSNAEFDYQWFIEEGEGDLNELTTDSVAFVPSESGVNEICLTITNINCPTLDTTFCQSIEIDDVFEVPVDFESSFCEGDSILVSLVGDYPEITWSNGIGASSFYAIDEGQYAVTVIDEFGCTGFAEIELTWDELPSPNIEGVTSFCFSEDTELSLDNDYAEIEWSTGEDSVSIRITESGTFGVTVTDDNGCIGMTSIDITELSEINFDILGELEFCEETSTELSISESFESYNWSNDESTPSITVITPGTYQVTVTDVNNCTAESIVEVSQNLNPQPQIFTENTTICPNTSATLSLQESYEEIVWSTGETGTIEILVEEIGDYTVNVIDENGCEGSDNITIDLFNTEEPEFEGPDFFCAGENLTITLANEFVSYSWSNGINQSSITVSQPGEYAVTVTDANSCTTENSIIIDELMLPTPDITSSDNVCVGETATLEAEDGFETYEWSNGDTGQTITISNSATYILEVTDEFGCSGTNEITIVFNENPNPEISGSRSFCTGRTTTISAGDYVSYLWNDGSTNQTLIVDSEGTYSVTVTDSNGCTGEANVEIFEADRLFPELSGSTSFCEGGSTVLDGGTSFSEYIWSTGETSNAITVSSPGEYSLTVVDADGCSGDVTANVVENSNPEPDIAGSDVFCTGRFTVLSVSGFNAYEWSTGSINDNVQVNQPGIYSVTVIDGNGCSGSSSIEVTELSELEPEIVGTLFFCEGNSTELIAEDGFESYFWNTGGNQQSISVSSPGVYVLEVTDALECTGSSQVTVTEEPNPLVIAGDDQEINCSDTIVTIGTTLGDSDAPFIHYWTNISNDQRDTFSTALTVSISEEGVFEMTTINTTTGCSARDTVIVNLNDEVIRDISLTINDAGCFGEINGIIELLDIDGGTPPFTIFYNNAEVEGPPFRRDDLPPGDYSLRIVDNVGCTWSRLIEIEGADSLGVSLGDNLLLDLGDTALLSPYISLPDSLIDRIIWYVDGQVICEPCEESQLLISPNDESLFTIRVVDQFGCLDEASVNVLVRVPRRVFIPNAFTPDDDGVNDRWIIFGDDNLELIQSIQVFDRWGNMVYEAEDLVPGAQNGAWDGTYRGQELRPGSYVYKVNVLFDDGETFVEYGEVTIIK